jgi:hypothetical protein
VGCQLQRTPKSHPTGLRALAAVIGTSPDQLALELSEATKHGQHQTAVRGRGVCLGVLKRLEAGASLGDGIKDIEEIPGRARQPVEPRHHISLSCKRHTHCRPIFRTFTAPIERSARAWSCTCHLDGLPPE